MNPALRTILIVEDDRLLSESYKTACRLAIYELTGEALPVEVRIIQAYTLNEAFAEIKDAPRLDFVSVDLALDPSEQGIRQEQRTIGREAGGMRILRQLKERQPAPVAVVISGETLLSYATDALQRYGVMHFFEKARFDIEQYKAVVKAALWYIQAVESLEQLEQADSSLGELDEAARCWGEARASAAAAGIDAHRFPSDLELRLKAARARFTDQATGLPIGRLAQGYLKQYVLLQHWSVFCVHVTNFATFRAAYPSQVDPLLFFLAETVREATASYAEAFTGLLGTGIGADPTLVVALNIEQPAELGAIKSRIEATVAHNAPMFTSSLSKAPAPSVPAVHVACWHSKKHQFSDLNDLLDALGSTN
ncbi:MAG: hypothetical protein HGA45_13385 [Chloroflexales bacterium]|nr:hypothetical protein [Chloroflexales bacterium]